MSITAYRITKTKRVKTAFDGEGARLYGGRWNSIGTRMIYVAGSRSLATLEILVHTEDVSTIEGQYSIIPVTFPEKLVLRISPADLPKSWSSPEPLAETQIFGDRWILGSRSAILEVPSAVTNEESNYLLNPAHPDFASIVIGDGAPFRIDPRLA
jgi:RES domain-containing protein